MARVTYQQLRTHIQGMDDDKLRQETRRRDIVPHVWACLYAEGHRRRLEDDKQRWERRQAFFAMPAYEDDHLRRVTWAYSVLSRERVALPPVRRDRRPDAQLPARTKPTVQVGRVVLTRTVAAALWHALRGRPIGGLLG